MIAALTLNLGTVQTEPTTNLVYADFVESVARYLGMEAPTAPYESTEELRLVEFVDDGYREFIFAYPWSFREIATTLTTVSGTGDYDMPPNFGGFIGPLTFAASSFYPSVQVVSEIQIREMRERFDETGYPRLVAIRPKTCDGLPGQRFEAMFYPEPDSAYPLTYRFNVVANSLSLDGPHPLGGPTHAGTIKAACLAAAELGEGDAEGPQRVRYERLLARSKINDQSAFTPEIIGYNANRSDGRGPLRRIRSHLATYEGEIE